MCASLLGAISASGNVAESQYAPGRGGLVHLQINARPLVTDGSVSWKGDGRFVYVPSHGCRQRLDVAGAGFARICGAELNGSGISGLMAKFVVEVRIVFAIHVFWVPGKVSVRCFIGIQICHIHHAAWLSDRHCRQKLLQSAGSARIGALCADTVAQLLYSS